MNKAIVLFVSAAFFGLAPFAVAADRTAPGSDLPRVQASELPRPQTLEGEVLRFEGNYYIVKDMNGKEVRLYTDKTTKVDGNLSPGDKIVARTAALPADAAPYASSIGKLGSPRIVEGRIVSMNKGYYIVEDPHGKEVRIYADSGTNTDGALQVGDRVVIYTARIPDAYADSITKR
jgi:hypothetical protein